MRLNFDYPYADYADLQNWLPRLDELTALAGTLARTEPDTLSDAELLDRLEDVEELMRYYTAVSDHSRLKPVVQIQDRLLQSGRRRGLSSIPFRYFCMEYERVDAVLYRSVGQNRKSAEIYSSACETAEQCFSELRQDRTLDKKQTLFVGWACQEVLNEAAQVFDSIAEYARTISCLERDAEMLAWLEPYMADAMGIRDKTADLYSTCGGVFFQNGRIEKGRASYRTSVRMFRELSSENDSDFWYARSLWVMALYGIQEFLCCGDPGVMLECERESEAALRERFAGEREIAIAQAAAALVMIQKGAACQQNGNLTEAARYTGQGIDLCKQSLGQLERDTQGKSSAYQTVLGAITSKIFASWIGALDSFGVQLYHNSQYGEAKKAFQEVLELLTKPDQYALSEVACTITRAECMNYMAMIAMEEGNADELVFYAEQSAALTSELRKKVKNAILFQLEGYACSLLAEYYLNTKNKAKAQQYAELGLSACAEWQAIEPQNGQPALVPLLEKFRKKASRRFF